MTESSDVFISYHSGDLRYAELVHDKLRDAGFKVWFDRARLNPGCDWYREIEAGCEASRVVLPILTPRWQTSEWTKFETYAAEAVIPLLFEGLFLDVAPVPLHRFQAETIDCEDTARTDWTRLFAALREKLAQPRPEKASRVAHLRYGPNDHFVGREQELLAICEALHRAPTAALTQGRVQAVVAMGGIGKTTLARQYAEKFWRLYPQMFWVDCRAGIENELARIAEILVPELRTADVKDSDKARRALQELNGSITCLLILDNAEDEESVQAWIPKSGACRTIITSRFTVWSAAVESLHVYVLAPEPARDLLFRRAGRTPVGDELEAGDELAKKLDYLPLALEQAAAYVGEQGPAFGFRDYLRLFEQAQRELLAAGVLGSTQYPDSVMTTWKASIEKMPAGARSVLRLSSFLAPTPIPIEMFIVGANTVRDQAAAFGAASAVDASSEGGDEFYVRECVRALARYSLIRSDGQQYSVHTLIQAVERFDVAAKQRASWVEHAAALLAAYAPRGAHLFENWPAWSLLLPHADRLWHQAQQETSARLPLALLDGLSGAHLARGEYVAGVAVGRRLVEAAEEQLGSEHPDTLTSIDSLALLLQGKGEYADAEPLYRRALAGHERVLGPEHPRTLNSVNNLAFLLQNKGEYAEAEPLYRRALEGFLAFSRRLGQAHPHVSVILDNYSECLKQLGQDDQVVRTRVRELFPK